VDAPAQARQLLTPTKASAPRVTKTLPWGRGYVIKAEAFRITVSIAKTKEREPFVMAALIARVPHRMGGRAASRALLITEAVTNTDHPTRPTNPANTITSYILAQNTNPKTAMSKDKPSKHRWGSAWYEHKPKPYSEHRTRCTHCGTLRIRITGTTQTHYVDLDGCYLMEAGQCRRWEFLPYDWPGKVTPQEAKKEDPNQTTLEI